MYFLIILLAALGLLAWGFKGLAIGILVACALWAAFVVFLIFYLMRHLTGKWWGWWR
jgi:hypothetical protein